MSQNENFMLGLSSYVLTLGLAKRFIFNKTRYDHGLDESIQQAHHYCSDAVESQRVLIHALFGLEENPSLTHTVFLLSTQIQDAFYKCHHALIESNQPQDFSELVKMLDSLRSFWSDNTAKEALTGTKDVWDFEHHLERSLELESAILERISEF